MSAGKGLFRTELPGPKKKAPEIVWLHGWGHSHQSLLPLAGLFKGSYRNTLYDLPGFGASERLAKGAGTADYAELLIEDLDRRKNPPVILAGHSFGCRVALRLARKRPDLVQAMVLISAAGLKRKRGILFRLKSWLLKILGRLASFWDRLFKTRLKQAYSQKFGSRDYRQAGALRATFVKTVTEDLSPVASAIQCPVLLIYGAEDRETPPELGTRYAGLIKDAELKILPALGHLDILTAGKHKCQHLISSFLKRAGD